LIVAAGVRLFAVDHDMPGLGGETAPRAVLTMRLRLLLAIVITAAGGCQTGARWNQHIELLHAERRTLEDELYALQFQHEDALARLSELQRENASLKQRLGLPDGRPRESEPARKVPARPPGRRSPSAGPQLSPPLIEEGILSEPRIELPEDAPGRSSGLQPPSPPLAPPGNPGPGRLAAPVQPSSHAGGTRTLAAGLDWHQPIEPGSEWSLEPSDPRVTHIVLNPLLTGGDDFDRRPGDDGLVVVVEPRNEADAFVPLAGPLTLVLLDPTLTGEEARVARWEIDAHAASEALANTRQRKGIWLRLPWSGSPPRSNRLQLFVRYGTVDGRQLETQREVFIVLPGDVAHRWMPRATAHGFSATSQDLAGPSLAPAREGRPTEAGPLSHVLPAAAWLPIDVTPASSPGPSAERLADPPAPESAAAPARASGQTEVLPWRPER
jgi:hypothetical protein